MKAKTCEVFVQNPRRDLIYMVIERRASHLQKAQKSFSFIKVNKQLFVSAAEWNSSKIVEFFRRRLRCTRKTVAKTKITLLICIVKRTLNCHISKFLRCGWFLMELYLFRFQSRFIVYFIIRLLNSSWVLVLKFQYCLFAYLHKYVCHQNYL